MSQSGQRAGRSTATLKNALEVLKSGRDVVYVTTSQRQAEAMCRQARELLYREVDAPGAYAGDYKFEKALILRGPNARLQFQTIDDPSWGVRTVVVPDHAAYETVMTKYTETLRDKMLQEKLDQLLGEGVRG